MSGNAARTYIFAGVIVCHLISSSNRAGAVEPPKSNANKSKRMTLHISDELRAVAQSNNDFGFDLYKHLQEREGNLFFSPASISTALAMTYAGAGGETKKQMGDVLHFDRPNSETISGFSTLTSILNSDEPGYRLNMANRLWAQKGHRFEQPFLTITRERFKAELEPLDFAESEEARRAINSWVEKQTSGKIQDLIGPGVLNSMTRLVLTNAIYFKGAWQEPFWKDATKDAPFRFAKDKQVYVPMMRITEDFGYAESDTVDLLELPYGGNEISMVILLPKDVDGLSKLEAQLTPETVRSWTSKLRNRKVQVYFPKFKMTSEFTLSDTLRTMGMPLAFSNQADFSGISADEALKISEVVHKAFVDVNEEGTEAAAATGVILAPTSAISPTKPPVFRADHPFVFLIRDNRTGAVLFLGRIVNPKH
jgi:serine protease inhibitor